MRFPCRHFGFRPAAGFDALEPKRAWGVDEEDVIAPMPPAGLEEHRRVEEDEADARVVTGLGDFLVDAAADVGILDAFQGPAFRVVGEDDFRQSSAIDLTSRVEEDLAPAVADGGFDRGLTKPLVAECVGDDEMPADARAGRWATSDLPLPMPPTMPMTGLATSRKRERRTQGTPIASGSNRIDVGQPRDSPRRRWCPSLTLPARSTSRPASSALPRRRRRAAPRSGRRAPSPSPRG